MSERFIGGRHCGAIRVVHEADRASAVRACQCSFCSARGARTSSAPEGRLTIEALTSPNICTFGSRTADVMLCAICGAYVASLITGPNGRVGTLKVMGARVMDLWNAPAEPVTYDHETAAEKRARRLAKWTPTTWTGSGA